MILAKQSAASGLVLQSLDFFRLFFIKEKGPPSWGTRTFAQGHRKNEFVDRLSKRIRNTA